MVELAIVTGRKLARARRELSHVGTCKNKEVKDCAGYVNKCNACMGGNLCIQQVCEGLSLECVQCIVASNCGDSGNCPCGM